MLKCAYTYFVRTFYLEESGKTDDTENPVTASLNLLATWIYANDSYQSIWTYEDKWFVFIYKFAETIPPYGRLVWRAHVCVRLFALITMVDGSSV